MTHAYTHQQISSPPSGLRPVLHMDATTDPICPLFVPRFGGFSFAMGHQGLWIFLKAPSALRLLPPPTNMISPVYDGNDSEEMSESEFARFSLPSDAQAKAHIARLGGING